MKIRGPLPETKPTPHHPDEPAPGHLATDPARLESCVARWQGVEFVAPDLLALAHRANRLVLDHADAFATVVDAAAYDADAVRARLDAGERLVEFADLRLDPAAIRGLLVAAADLVDPNATERPALSDDAALAVIRGELAHDRDALVRAAADAGWEPEPYVFAAHAVAATALGAAAAALAPLVDDAIWHRATCPICGDSPFLAALHGDGGRRHLICGTCNFVWTFNRIACPFCGNDKATSLSVLSTDQSGPYRLAACSACHRYLKTIDYRVAAEGDAIVPAIDDAATFYLDIMADQEKLVRS